MNQKRLYQNLLELCQIESISNTPKEEAMLSLIGDKLCDIPYFKEFPAQVTLCRKGNGGGSFALALMRSTKVTDKTILLLSHFDVVGVEDYGAARHLAFSPEAYTDYLKEHTLSLSPEARDDLLSGHYLFGRGVCDMKWGISAHLELLRYFNDHAEELPCNLLFLSVSDEERYSCGMLDAVPFLLDFREKKNLRYLACVVSEPDIGSSDQKGLSLCVGAAGKLMPSFFCAGVQTHAGEPFLGLNPHSLTAAIVSLMENSPDFADICQGHGSPAPCCLKQGDLKVGYSVQTPGAAFAYFNMITLNSTPQNVLKAMKRVARKAISQVLRTRRKNWQAVQTKVGQPVPFREFQSRILTYPELLEDCQRRHPEIFEKHMEVFITSLSCDDQQTASVLIVQEACTFLDQKDPVVILFLCPPYYPHSSTSKKADYLLCACEQVVDEAARLGERIAVSPYFDGITDMCYLSFPKEIDLPSLRQNFPLWGNGYTLPVDEMGKLNIPLVNLGPKGKDAHQNTERLDLSYSLKVAPQLLRKLVTSLAKEEEHKL